MPRRLVDLDKTANVQQHFAVIGPSIFSVGLGLNQIIGMHLLPASCQKLVNLRVVCAM